VDGSGGDRFLGRLDQQVQEVTWTADGRWLLVRTDNLTAGAGDLFGIPVAGDSTSVPLVTSRFTEIEPAASPDSRWLAYTSDESGSREVYVRPFPNTTAGRWQVSNGGGSQARWSPDGQELFYRRPDGWLMAARLADGDAFFVDELRPLFDTSPYFWDTFHQSYDVGQNGQFVFMSLRRITGGQNDFRVVWVDHWLQDLNARLGQ
jgi:dipeptidyl aminopeptidase/acylaminoacyl peptidase